MHGHKLILKGSQVKSSRHNSRKLSEEQVARRLGSMYKPKSLLGLKDYGPAYQSQSSALYICILLLGMGLCFRDEASRRGGVGQDFER